MISVQDALRILHENIPEPRRERVSLDQAYNCYLSEDILSPEASPRYTNSAMDGFVVRWEDCAEATKQQPACLTIIGESQAGIPFENPLSFGSAVRISTGAMLPDGADSVVRVEDTREDGTIVEIQSIRSLGQDVRYEGEEFEKGALLFQKSICNHFVHCNFLFIFRISRSCIGGGYQPCPVKYDCVRLGTWSSSWRLVNDRKA